MANYLFETHYGVCTVTDADAGVSVQWEVGKFNETNRAEVDPLAQLNLNPDALTLARICREIADYIAENYKELI